MPILSDLDAAMMQPGFSVPALRRLGGGAIRLNDASRPLRATGRDAVVYELHGSDGRIVALRCLLRPEAARDGVLAARYQALAADTTLAILRGPTGPLPRDIRWIDEGIQLPGPDLQSSLAPVMAMERLPGRTLIRAVDRLCREGQSNLIGLLADRWLLAAGMLEAAGFSHGDLTADNLIVRPDGTIGLVDLDTANWPASSLRPSSGGGTPGYAHPRGAPHDAARRDRFPALIVWASLRILARHPGLREHFGDSAERHGATLLWSADDLRRPTRSALFAALDELGDDTLETLLEVVRRAIRFSPDDTPTLTEIASRLEALGFPAHAHPDVTEYLRIPELSAPASAEPAITPAWERPRPEGGGGGMAPAPLPSLREPTPATDPSPLALAAAREGRLAAAARLQAAVAARDVGEVTRLWAESGGEAESALLAPAVHQLSAREATAAIERAMRRREDDVLLAAMAAAESLGVAPSAEARTAARAARERMATRAALREAITAGDLPALAALAQSGRIDRLGRLEPAQARAVERALAWPALERALAGGDDATIVAAADSPAWRDEAALPAQARERLALARARLHWLSAVRSALRERDGPVLRDLLATAPPGAESQLTEVESRRVLRVSMREAAVARLERALREGPDQEVVAALNELQTAGTPLPDVLDWAAVRGVVDRISLAEALQAAAAADPPDAARLARLLPAARAALGDRGDADEPDWAMLELTVLRAAQLARLRDALAANDDARIAAAADPDPFAARSLLSEEEQARVARALAQGGARRG